MNTEWITRAPCAGHTETFTRATELCRTCPVQGLCLEYGLDEKHGVYGGLGPKARARLRRQLRKLNTDEKRTA